MSISWDEYSRELEKKSIVLKLNLPQLMFEIYGEPEPSLYGIELEEIEDKLYGSIDEHKKNWEEKYKSQGTFREYILFVANVLIKNDNKELGRYFELLSSFIKD